MATLKTKYSGFQCRVRVSLKDVNKPEAALLVWNPQFPRWGSWAVLWLCSPSLPHCGVIALGKGRSRSFFPCDQPGSLFLLIPECLRRQLYLPPGTKLNCNKASFLLTVLLTFGSLSTAMSSTREPWSLPWPDSLDAVIAETD